MATSPTVTVSPATIPFGGTAVATVAFALASARDVTVTLTDGDQSGSGVVHVNGEPFPDIKVAGDPTIVPADWVISSDDPTAVLTPDPTNQANFNLQV